MSAPAPASTRIRSQAGLDAGILLRNGEQLIVSMILPALALVVAAKAPYPDLGPGARVDVATPGVLALAVISTAFTGQAISTAFDRRYGVLRLLGVTPLGRSGLLAGRVLAVLVVEAIQFAVLAGLGLALGWRPDVVGVLPFLVFWLLGTATFVAFAMLLAGTLRPEATLAVANLIWVLLLGVGGVVLPADRFGAPWSRVVSLLPSAALGDGFRAAFEHHGLPPGPLLILLAWGAIFGFAASRWFRWSE